METTKQIIISKVRLVKGGIRINYEKYRDSNGRRAQGNLFESDAK